MPFMPGPYVTEFRPSITVGLPTSSALSPLKQTVVDRQHVIFLGFRHEQCLKLFQLGIVARRDIVR